MLKPHHRQYVAACLFDFAMVAALTFAPFYIFDHLEGGPGMAGIIMGVQWALYAFACLVSTGFVSRAKNGLVWAILGGGAFGVLFPASVIIKNPLYFGVLSTLAIAATGLFWPAMQAWIGSEPDPKLRLKRLADYNISWTIGLTTAPLIAAPLYAYDYRVLYVVVFMVSGGVVALIATLPHESSHFGEYSADMRETHAVHDTKSESHLYATWVSLLMACVLLMAMGVVFAKRTVEFVEAKSLVADVPGIPASWEPEAYFGILAFTMYFARALASFVMGRTHAWQHRFWVLVVSQALAAYACWVLAHTFSFLTMLVCSLVIGLNAGLCFFASQTYSVVDPVLKHRRLAIHETMVGAGCFVGAVGCGVFAKYSGTAAPFLWMPLFMAMAVAVQYGLFLRGAGRKAALASASEQS
ncbi:MAG: MFS transporter [bacterium]|nr:MFS transporter [bacterium]